MVLIRGAVASDARQLAALRWDLHAEDIPLDPSRREPFIDRHTRWFADALKGDWVAWVAEDSGRLYGHVFVRRVDRVPSPRDGASAIGYVTNFWVIPSMRKQGIGGELLRQMRAWAEGVPLAALVVWPSDASLRNYEDVGFTAGEVLQLPIKS